MEFYIIIAIIAYLAFAVNGVIDKFLLKKAIPQPATYAFYIGTLSGFTVLLIPFGFSIPRASIIILAFISGALFIYALTAMFSSLKYAEASRVLPTIGAIVPFVTYVLSFFILNERLSRVESIGFLLLIFGMILISFDAKEKAKSHHWLMYACFAGMLFALSFTLTKVVYLDQAFISGLVWTRFGLVLGALSILLIPSARKGIFKTTGQVEKPTGILFFAGQIIGAGAGITQSFAISLGSVTVVNALQGTQFGFLIVITAMLSRWHSKILKEDFSKSAVVKKVGAIILITLGLVLISL
ncbi:MAG: hypothetical protein COT91_05115 [Candidatus Doudnabacteria bacterium CG10_big_fil_rev_8_21_14_0_10_41_10]|uniref:EamA domain-containing protein n=1 Tax=Candidatus Doudnabacteria bacterium CG10_big_fil_rev_8_21_14_0_10_41_10 TaxID=1974551 RepID=A0A2H0VCA8_9BACT|nr:MAG: hypothetical protein COT91_05115 [Candidatus Doudnabacteria bacterium CG10_big_fil_rev_8_21_14_0_10_41_10]